MGSVRLVHYLMIMPAQLLLVGGIFVPALYIFWLSLNRSSFGQAPVWVGFANYGYILSDPLFWRAFWNTFIVVNVVVYGELLLGLGLAVLIAGWVPG
ncbi:MAG TPA: hypothetical protein VFG43_11300, partial [Geminicoccaceae bacterium]|nr:hypothetical protein [Geminicoccaceae bacterium]